MAERKSTSKYWAYFFMWIVILFLFIFFYRGFIWMAFPGIVTNFVLALGLMDSKPTNSPD